MITASSLARVMACPASELLPHVQRETQWSEAGTARHAYLASIGALGREKALAAVPDAHRKECAAIDLDGLPTHLASEVAFAWDVETGVARELGRDMGRNYSGCSATEIPGTIDVVGVGESDLYIGDFKGWQLVDARDNAQLLFAAMCAAKIYGRDRAMLEIINIRHGAPWRSRCHVDTFDLADFEQRLCSTLSMVATLKAAIVRDTDDVTLPAVVEGEHCKYCPAFDSCPAKTAIIRELVGGAPRSLLPIRPETATEAFLRLQQIKEVVKHVDAALHAYAKEQPIQLPDGKVFGAREKDGKEQLSGDVAYAVVKELHGQEIADLAVTRSTTKKAIKEAVRTAKERGLHAGTLKAGEDAILDAVRERGGSERKRSITIDVHKPALPPAEGAA